MLTRISAGISMSCTVKSTREAEFQEQWEVNCLIFFIPQMKVADLKRELKSRGLTTSGNKNELIERLQVSTHKLQIHSTKIVYADLHTCSWLL